MTNIIENISESGNSPVVISNEAASNLEFKIGGTASQKEPNALANNLTTGEKQPTEPIPGEPINNQPTNQQENTSNSNNTNPTQQNNYPVEITAEDFSSILSDATEGRIKDVNQVYQILEENTRLKEQLENPASLFKDATQRSIYEFLNDFKAGDFDSGIQGYARLKSLDIANMKPEDALKEKYIQDNLSYGISRVDSEKMFQAELDKKYGGYEEDVASRFIAKDGIDAKKALLEMQTKYTTPKVDEQAALVEQQRQANIQQYSQAVSKSMEGFNSLVFDLNGTPENNFTFEVKDTQSIADAINDPQAFLNSRWTGPNGFNAEQIKQDIAILSNLDNIIEGIANHAINIGKEIAIRERINVPTKTTPAPSNAPGGGGAIPKDMKEAILMASVKKMN